MNVYKKLQEARVKFHKLPLQKSGENKFAGYKYFELGDFLPAVQDIFNDIGLCGVVSFSKEVASLSIMDVEDSNSWIRIESPSAGVELKGCQPIQGIGAAQTYLRRYLWVTAMEIVENDAIDAVTGSEKKPEPVVQVKPKVAEIKPKAVEQKAATVDLKKPDGFDVMISMEKAIFADNWPEVSRIYYDTGLSREVQRDVWSRLEDVTKDYLKAEKDKRANG